MIKDKIGCKRLPTPRPLENGLILPSNRRHLAFTDCFCKRRSLHNLIGCLHRIQDT